MKKMTLLLATLLAVLATTLTTPAQPVKGDYELTLAGSGSVVNDLKDNAFGLSGDLGLYLSDAIKISVEQGVAYSSMGDSAVGETGVGLTYNIQHKKLGALVPFLGGHAVALYGNTPLTWAAGPVGGLKFYVAKKAFLYGKVGYNFMLNGPKNDALNYGIGVGFNF